MFDEASGTGVPFSGTFAAAIILVPNRAGAAGTGRRLLALIAATAAATGAGFAQGAHSAQSVVFVALGFAICCVGGLTLLTPRQ